MNDSIRVSPLEGNLKVKVVGLIRKASLLVQHIKTSVYIIEKTETILILGTDWFDRY